MENTDAAPAKDLMESTAQTAAATDAAPTLSLADLQNLLLVVGVACKRGAVQPQEMKTVGEVYERVESYVKHVTSQQSQK
jgi:imidazolonepropionase-like amidohydrolase